MRERNCADSKSRIIIVTFTFLQLWLMGTVSQLSLHSHEAIVKKLLNEMNVFNSASNVMTYFCKGCTFSPLLFLPEVTEHQPSICSYSLILLTYILEENVFLRLLFSISTPPLQYCLKEDIL